MKKEILSTIFILMSMVSFAQEIKTIKKKVQEQYGKAVFYVLADDDTIKHGLYLLKAYTGTRLLSKGHFNHNKRVGLWEEQYYGKQYNGPKAIGYYNNDEKIGRWVYFGGEGDTLQIYDWSEEKMIFFKSCGMDTKDYSIIDNGIEKKTFLDCPPTCISGLENFLYEFNRDLDATKFKTIGNGLYQLKTRISILIDEHNLIKQILFSTNESEELKEIIEKYIRTFHWLAGIKGNKPVATWCEFSVNFSAQF